MISFQVISQKTLQTPHHSSSMSFALLVITALTPLKIKCSSTSNEEYEEDRHEEMNEQEMELRCRPLLSTTPSLVSPQQSISSFEQPINLMTSKHVRFATPDIHDECFEPESDSPYAPGTDKRLNGRRKSRRKRSNDGSYPMWPFACACVLAFVIIFIGRFV